MVKISPKNLIVLNSYKKEFLMKGFTKLMLFGIAITLVGSITMQAMEPPQPAASSSVAVQPKPIVWGTPVEKPCCCILCCPQCLKCFCGFMSCCFKASSTYGGIVIKLAEAIALPFPEAQKILGTINDIYTKAQPLLVPLAAACQDASQKLPAEYIAALLQQGIDLRPYVNADGSPKPELAAVVNAALTVQTTTTRGSEPRVRARILSTQAMYDRFLVNHMLYQADE